MSGQRNTIYLADDKDGNKMIAVLSPFHYTPKLHKHLDHQRGQEASNFTEVGSLMDKAGEFEWEEYFTMGEFVQLMLGELEFYTDNPSHAENMLRFVPADVDVTITYSKVQYGYHQLKNLCERTVAGTEEKATLRFGVDFEHSFGPSHWSAYVDVDPVLAQAILDSYN